MAEAKAKKESTKVADTQTQTTANEEVQVVEQNEAQESTDTSVAKAGKRSAKSIKEAEVKAAKEARKAQTSEEAPATKSRPKTRSKLERRGKKYREQSKNFDSTKEYSLKEALDIATKTSPTKFDATVELHINLGVDPRHADQNVRDNLVLPAGTGRNVRVAVFADVEDQATAKKAGADIAANEDFLAQLEKGTIDFDILIAPPSMMPKLGKYARLLGPKGLMPNPKSGTVTTDVAKAVQEAKAGRVEYRVDSTGIVHLGIGKVSFGTDALMQNAEAVVASIKSVKPQSIKGNYVKRVTITTTMGPGIRVLASEIA